MTNEESPDRDSFMMNQYAQHMCVPYICVYGYVYDCVLIGSVGLWKHTV